MAKVASTPFGFKFPHFDMDTLFALQRDNLVAMREAQDVLLDAFQTAMRAQYGLVEDVFAAGRSTLIEVKGGQKPETMMDGAKGAAEKAMSVARHGVELNVAAQQRVADLFAKRAAANVEGFKSLLAA